MKTYNTAFTTKTHLKKFISKSRLYKEQNLLIQIFSGNTKKEDIKNLIDFLDIELPQAKIIWSTTSWEIVDGLVVSDTIVLSFSCFKYTQVETYFYYNKNSYKAGKVLAEKSFTNETKAAIIFADGLYTNWENLMKWVYDENNQVVIAWWMAGDNSQYEKTYVFTKDKISEKWVVVATLEGKQLFVHNQYNFGRETIGKKLLITKSSGTRIYTIDGQKAYDVYIKYLGKEYTHRDSLTGIHFVTVVHRNWRTISRSVKKIHRDGSLSFSGRISEWEEIQFAFGNAEMILNSFNIFKELPSNAIQSIFVYSCEARKKFMPAFIWLEIAPLQRVAATAWFFTYGEFFHTQKWNELVGKTMTILALSEEKKEKRLHKNGKPTMICRGRETRYTQNAYSFD